MESLLLHFGEHNPHALSRTTFGDAAADATGCTGDDGHFVLEFLHRVSLWGELKSTPLHGQSFPQLGEGGGWPTALHTRYNLYVADRFTADSQGRIQRCD